VLLSLDLLYWLVDIELVLSCEVILFCYTPAAELGTEADTDTDALAVLDKPF